MINGIKWQLIPLTRLLFQLKTWLALVAVNREKFSFEKKSERNKKLHLARLLENIATKDAMSLVQKHNVQNCDNEILNKKIMIYSIVVVRSGRTGGQLPTKKQKLWTESDFSRALSMHF